MLKREDLKINGISYIKHYAVDEYGKKYKIKQIETRIIYENAIDVVPCRYTYEETSEEVEQLELPQE